MKNRIKTHLLLFVSIFLNQVVFSQTNGYPDNTFQTGTGFTDVVDGVLSIGIQDDGKIIVLGNFTRYQGIIKHYLARLNFDGSLDDGFNINNTAFTYIENPKTVFPLNNGKFLVVHYGYNSYLKRFNNDGTIDNTFILDSQINEYINHIDTLSNGKVVISGPKDTLGNTLFVLNQDGTVFQGFGSNIPITGSNYRIGKFDVQDDDKIVCAINIGYEIFRFNTNGTLDLSFNGQEFNNVSRIVDLKIQNDGKILLGVNNSFTGELSYGGQPVNSIFRLNPNGTLENNFGSDEIGYSILGFEIQNDGKIICNNSSKIRRYNIDGTIDLSFVDNSSSIECMKFQSDGRLLVGGRFEDYRFNGNEVYAGRIIRLGCNTTSQINTTSTNPLCYGETISINTTAESEGNNPIYNWYVNNTLVPNNNTNILQTQVLSNLDIQLEVISDAQCNSGNYLIGQSNELNLSLVEPSISVSSNQINNTFCQGEEITFTSTSINEGTNPIYEWEINGVSVGTNNSIFSSSLLNNGDTITCNIISNEVCVNPNPISSNNIIVNIISNFSSETIVENCLDYTWNGNSYSQSGIYTANFTNINGCDSIATLNLTILNPTSSSETVSTCGTYFWNNNTYDQSGTYSTILTNVSGCDSVANLVLTITQSNYGSETIQACGNYSWNGNTYASSGTYTSTFTNGNGCDSIATLNLTITQPSSSSETIQACENYSWNGNTYASSGTYTTTFPNGNGCDSIATLNLTITQPSSSSETIQACGNYSWNGNTYASTGTYTTTFPNGNGCDSIATLNLSIHPNPNVSLPNFGAFCDTLEAFTLTGGTPSGGVYSGTSVSNNTFNPSIGAGTYEITYTFEDANGCVNFDLSNIEVIACESNIGLAENNNEHFLIYPNPASSSITVLLQTENTNSTLNIYSVSGQKLLEKQNLGKTTKIDISNFSKGIYFLEIGNVRQKFVVE
jgi:uncharacterized delta-60 repeat protein